MDVVLVTDVDDHCHSGLRLAQRHRLSFTQLGPVALVRLRFAGVPVSELHEVERKLMTPRSSPIANHDWEKRAVLISTSGVTLALIPDGAANRERDKRRNHRVVKHTRIVLITDSDSFRARAPVRMFRFGRQLYFVIPRSTQRDQRGLGGARWSKRHRSTTTEAALTSAI